MSWYEARGNDLRASRCLKNVQSVKTELKDGFHQHKSNITVKFYLHLHEKLSLCSSFTKNFEQP